MTLSRTDMRYTDAVWLISYALKQTKVINFTNYLHKINKLIQRKINSQLYTKLEL